jgi:hypothetical protein
MGDGTTGNPSTYPPAFTLDGEWTLYPPYFQANAEARPLIPWNAPLLCQLTYIQAYPTGPIWRIDGSGTTNPESLPPPGMRGHCPLNLLKYLYLT